MSNLAKFFLRLNRGTVGKLFSSHTLEGCLGSMDSWSCGVGIFLKDASKRSNTYFRFIWSVCIWPAPCSSLKLRLDWISPVWPLSKGNIGVNVGACVKGSKVFTS